MSLQSVADDLVALSKLDRTNLGERWASAFGVLAPRGSREQLLRKAIAWHIQMQASAQWSDKSGSARLTRSIRKPVAVNLAPGTRLLREWQGRTHQVMVLSKGFEYDGVAFRSLSAIARKITGTPWSGPKDASKNNLNN